MGQSAAPVWEQPGRSLAWALAVAVLTLAPMASAAAAVTDGMLKADDVALSVISKPHRSTVIAIDRVDPSDCSASEPTEREARVVSFAQDPNDPVGAAQLNQVVYDFPSTGAAKAFFADLRANEQQRVDCGSTEKATGFKMANGPKGVGQTRFAVTSKEKVGNTTRLVTSVQVLTGSNVTALIFLDWGKGLPSTTTIAKKAVARLG